jgi:cation:H+ antiporter
MEILQLAGIFAASLTGLLLAAKFFTEAGEKIGVLMKIPPFIIGVTIIALGTSLPEIATSVISVMNGHSEFVIGNVVGSNVANILLVLAIAAIVAKQLKVDKNIISIDLPILLGSTILLFIITLDGEVTYVDGTFSILILLTYLIYNVRSHRTVNKDELKQQKQLDKSTTNKSLFKHLAVLTVSGTALYFAADYTIQSVVELSKIFNIGTEIIAVSAIAIGTSLPELVVSIVAARKGQADIAIGNVTGSNIFNALGVIGIPSLFGTLTIPDIMLTFGIPSLVLITILYIFTTMDKEVSKWEGITLLLIYAAFMGKTFGFI